MTQAHLDVLIRDPMRTVPELLHHQFGGIGIDGLRDGRHHAHLHQGLDHLTTALRHAIGKLLDGNGLGNGNVAHDLLALLQALSRALLFAFTLTTDLSQGTLARFLLTVVQCTGNGKLALTAAGLALGAGRGDLGGSSLLASATRTLFVIEHRLVRALDLGLRLRLGFRWSDNLRLNRRRDFRLRRLDRRLGSSRLLSLPLLLFLLLKRLLLGSPTGFLLSLEARLFLGLAAGFLFDLAAGLVLSRLLQRT